MVTNLSKAMKWIWLSNKWLTSQNESTLIAAVIAGQTWNLRFKIRIARLEIKSSLLLEPNTVFRKLNTNQRTCQKAYFDCKTIIRYDIQTYMNIEWANKNMQKSCCICKQSFGKAARPSAFDAIIIIIITNLTKYYQN